MRRYGLLVSTILAAASAFAAATSALAALPPGVPGIVAPQGRTFVIGRDTEITVNVELPDSCAGSSVEMRLFQTPADGSNGLVPPTAPELAAITVVATAPKGGFSMIVPLPREITGDPARVLPTMVGKCLPAPVHDFGLGVDLAKVDAAENPGNTSTIVVYGPALKWIPPTNPEKVTFGEFTGSITVLANGVACTTADVGKGATTDASGNVRIHLGTAGQPPQCSTAGAALTFVRADGATLYETRTLMPGVTQQLQNLAREPIPDGPTPTPTTTVAPTSTAIAPAPPNTGGQGPASNSGSPVAWLAVAGGLGAVVVLAGGLVLKRRP